MFPADLGSAVCLGCIEFLSEYPPVSLHKTDYSYDLTVYNQTVIYVLKSLKIKEMLITAAFLLSFKGCVTIELNVIFWDLLRSM